MTTLLRDKRALERHVGAVEFRRGGFRTSEEHDVEVHAVTPMEWDDADRTHESTWLGHGDTHVDAIADCYETLRVRSVIRSRAEAREALEEREEARRARS